MIHYCKHCGALLEDDAKVCSFCNAAVEIPVEEPEAPAPVVEVPPKKSFFTALDAKQKKTLIIASSVLLGTIILVVAIYFLFFGSHYAAVKFNAVINGSYWQLESLAPREYWDAQAKKGDMTRKEYIKDQIESLKEFQVSLDESYGKRFGDDYALTVSVLYSEPAEDDILPTVQNALAKQYSIDPSRVTAVHNMYLKGVISGSESSYTTVGSIMAVQLDGQWYFIRFNYGFNSTEPNIHFVATGIFSSLNLY